MEASHKRSTRTFLVQDRLFLRLSGSSRIAGEKEGIGFCLGRQVRWLDSFRYGLQYTSSRLTLESAWFYNSLDSRAVWCLRCLHCTCVRTFTCARRSRRSCVIALSPVTRLPSRGQIKPLTRCAPRAFRSRVIVIALLCAEKLILLGYLQRCTAKGSGRKALDSCDRMKRGKIFKVQFF